MARVISVRKSQKLPNLKTSGMKKIYNVNYGGYLILKKDGQGLDMRRKSNKEFYKLKK